MIVLNGTAIILRLVTSAAVAVDANIGFFDSNMGVTPPTFATGAQRTKISTATTSTIGSAPASGVTREIKYVGICATGGACIVRPEVFDATNAFQCVGDATGVPLAVGETLEYVDTTGWSVKDVNGAVKYSLGPTLNGHIVKDNGTARTQRASLNMLNTDSMIMSAIDDSINNKTDLTARPSGRGTDNSGGASIVLGSGDSFQLITSTTAITTFTFTNDFVGRKAYITFTTARTLTHSGTLLILPTAANITTAAGDTCVIESLGSGNFKVLDYTRANGFPLVTGRLLRAPQVVSATNATFAHPTGCSLIIALVVAAGGGGTGAVNSSAAQITLGAGGASGGHLYHSFTSVSGTSNVTIGAAGAAGANTGAAAGNGGDSTVVHNGVTVVAKGGPGAPTNTTAGMAGVTGTTFAASPGALPPAVSTGADFNGGGAEGGIGLRFSGTVGQSGNGGACIFGGAAPGRTTQGAGNTAIGKGGGGGGGLSTAAGGAVVGGAALGGFVIFWEFG